MSKQNEHKLLIFALGGVGEIGKNMYVVEYGDDIVIIDAGLKYPEEDMLGIDIVIPDITYLEENKERIRGIVVTHGHEDHIGALPYVLKRIKAPIFATKLTLGLIESKLKEANLLHQVKRVLIHKKSKIKLGCFTLTFFKTNHSIPDSVGVCIDTPEGRVVHTGDFKFDYTPINDEHADIGRMAEIGEQGVLALLSDSTNAERPGYTRSEKEVGRAIVDQFFKAKGRIIVATFASNIHRIQNVFDAALETNRKVAIVGRHVSEVVRIARELGYLYAPDHLLIDIDEMNRLPAHKVCILSAGSQGEPISALTRMAKSSHKQVDIIPGDTVIFAATPIPGNEKLVSRTIDQLFRAGAHVVYGLEGVHVSGHGSQEELKLMLNLMKPKYFIPIHGEYRMLRQHGKLAEATGVPSGNIFLIENGDIVEFHKGKARLGGKVPAGHVLIDGLGVGDVGNIVLRDRKLLSQDGILIVVVTLSKETGSVISGPDIISRGFVYVRESEELMDEAIQLVMTTLEHCQNVQTHDWSTLKTHIRDALSRFLYEQTRRRPMILPIIMEA
ncbi:Ribocuclease J [Caldalkalibacillus thermarum TA2.A1]|uniref:Ribonuclease J n=1 Tax=Caldalkalibacillus thermarum (strain TA2.A1) TaxID=986075 RepID=F5L9S7_CALTT|nr:ribonuclease J [Caldalkalibacillus thermarum]EGL81926.1 Ribocuclease J [Caldalkalibacillus thermarum TA2.A1]QZT32969.1 ribonuclease J [Caldalkalibacillus thermarum TA2.A1]GGK13288.1 ribonuclease J [Caldalkalibacillus thermarum]